MASFAKRIKNIESRLDRLESPKWNPPIETGLQKAKAVKESFKDRITRAIFNYHKRKANE